MTFCEYVGNRLMHKTTLYSYSNGVGHFILNGKSYTDEEFEKMYPITTFPKMELPKNKVKTDDMNHANNWLNDKKSY